MTEPKKAIQRPRPTAGIINNLDDFKDKGISFQTIIGAITRFDAPQRPIEEIPCTPGLGMFYWNFKVGDDPDTQKPHFQDEIYIILEGKGAFELDTKTIEIKTGDILFVPALMKHHFISNGKDDIRVLIFFGPDWCGKDATQKRE